MPTTKSRLRSIAARAAPTSASARSFVSPSGMMPLRPTFTSTRPRCGAARVTASTSSRLSAPPEPASMNPVTPSRRHIAGPGMSRPACVWMSMSPGTTSLPRASSTLAACAVSDGSTAAIRPPAIPTSRTPSRRSDGSITRPPLISRSKRPGCASARATVKAKAAPAAALVTKSRRVSIEAPPPVRGASLSEAARHSHGARTENRVLAAAANRPVSWHESRFRSPS